MKKRPRETEIRQNPAEEPSGSHGRTAFVRKDAGDPRSPLSSGTSQSSTAFLSGLHSPTKASLLRQPISVGHGSHALGNLRRTLRRINLFYSKTVRKQADKESLRPASAAMKHKFSLLSKFGESVSVYSRFGVSHGFSARELGA